MMNYLYLITALMIVNVQAFGLVCNQVRNTNASELLIDYKDGKASGLSFRQQDQTEYRKQDVTIQLIVNDRKNGIESFNAIPNYDVTTINWENETNCYKEVGSQLYFNLFHTQGSYYVTIMPYYVKESETCRTPRNFPQQHQLDCNSNE